MQDDDILILKGNEVCSLLKDRELELIEVVRRAYEAHATGNSSLPHSTFLRFPDNQTDRIIALPAYIGDDFDLAGIKWIASFPGNPQGGRDRASAVIVVNSTKTGRPTAILEGSIISAKRTAASAALAAQTLRSGSSTTSLGIIGCGLINFETVRFLLASSKDLSSISLFDLRSDQTKIFERKCRALSGQVKIQIAKDVDSVLQNSQLISIATTATQPHILEISKHYPGATLLHLSLRDLSPKVILSSDNVVDDIDHVCRAQTSIHLAEQLTGNRNFIRCTLADALKGARPARINEESVTIFSPFGLGTLDLAVSKLTVEIALRQGQGTTLSSFLPDHWIEKE